MSEKPMSRIDYQFQKDAVDELVDLVEEELESGNKRSAENNILFVSPVASGKTTMCGDAMDRIADDVDDVSFVWLTLSKGGLDMQAWKSFARRRSDSVSYYALNSFVRQADSDSRIPAHSCCIAGWDTLNKSSNKQNKRAETATFASVMEDFRGTSRIVLFIDEAHANITKKWKEIVDLIHPYVIVLVTATPKMSSKQFSRSLHKVIVQAEDVAAEGKIKSSVFINDGRRDDEIPWKRISGAFSEKDLIAAGLRCSYGLERRYRDAGMSVVPLVVIQLPNDEKVGVKQQRENTSRQVAQAKEILVGELGVAPESVAIWTATEKEDATGQTVLSGELASSSHRFLITKLAVSTGWDCPRAQVLVKLRSPSQSETLDAQTLGRIYRTTDPREWLRNDRYRNDLLLNSAFVYTDAVDYDPTIGGLSYHDGTGKMGAQVVPAARPFMRQLRLVRTVAGAKEVHGSAASNLSSGITALLRKNFPRGYKNGGYWSYEPSTIEVAQGTHEVSRMYDSIAKRGYAATGHTRREIGDAEIEDIVHAKIRKTPRMRQHARIIIETLEAYARTDLMQSGRARGNQLPSAGLFSSPAEIAEQQRQLEEKLVDLYWGVYNGWQAFEQGVIDVLDANISYAENMVYDGHDAEHPLWTPPMLQLCSKESQDAEPPHGYAYACGQLAYDSTPEREFAEKYLAADMMDFWFKNGTDTASSFCIVYEQPANNLSGKKKRNFFPDFIGIRGRTLYILERKGDLSAKGDDAIDPENDVRKLQAIREWMDSSDCADSVAAMPDVDRIVFSMSRRVNNRECIYEGYVGPDGRDYSDPNSDRWKSLDQVIRENDLLDRTATSRA